MRSDLNVRIEISLALKIIADIAATLLQKILIHRAFGIDRQQLAQFAFAEPGTA